MLENNLTEELDLFWGSEIFDFLVFWGLEKLSYFFGSEGFLFIFGGGNIVMQSFWGVSDSTILN